MAAKMQINQVGLAGGTIGRARSDGLATGAVVTLVSTAHKKTFRFRLLWVGQHPNPDTTSKPSLQKNGTNTYTFTPSAGVFGSWRIELITDEGTPQEDRQRRIFAIKSSPSAIRIPAPNEASDPDASIDNVDATRIDRSEFNEAESSGPFQSGTSVSAWRAMADTIQGVNNGTGGSADISGVLVSELSAIPVTADNDGDPKFCRGLSPSNPRKGGGTWYASFGDTSTPDGWQCIAATGGRWRRQVNAELNVEWFGARGDFQGPGVGSSTNDYPAFVACYEAARLYSLLTTSPTLAPAYGGSASVFIPAANYRWSEGLLLETSPGIDYAGIRTRGGTGGVSGQSNVNIICSGVVLRGRYRFVGTNGSPIAKGTQVIDAGLRVYRTRAAVTISGGEAIVEIECLAAGTTGFIAAGTAMNLVSPVTGVTTGGSVWNQGSGLHGAMLSLRCRDHQWSNIRFAPMYGVTVGKGIDLDAPAVGGCTNHQFENIKISTDKVNFGEIVDCVVVGDIADSNADFCTFFKCYFQLYQGYGARVRNQNSKDIRFDYCNFVGFYTAPAFPGLPATGTFSTFCGIGQEQGSVCAYNCSFAELQRAIEVGQATDPLTFERCSTETVQQFIGTQNGAGSPNQVLNISVVDCRLVCNGANHLALDPFGNPLGRWISIRFGGVVRILGNDFQFSPVDFTYGYFPEFSIQCSTSSPGSMFMAHGNSFPNCDVFSGAFGSQSSGPFYWSDGYRNCMANKGHQAGSATPFIIPDEVSTQYATGAQNHSSIPQTMVKALSATRTAGQNFSGRIICKGSGARVTTGNVNGTATITSVANVAGIVPGQAISGSGFPADARVDSVVGSTVVSTHSTATTATGSALTFTDKFDATMISAPTIDGVTYADYQVFELTFVDWTFLSSVTLGFYPATPEPDAKYDVMTTCQEFTTTVTAAQARVLRTSPATGAFRVILEAPLTAGQYVAHRWMVVR